MTNPILDKIYENKIIAVVRGIDSDKIVDTVSALVEGGVVLFEIPFNQKYPETSKDTLETIGILKKEFKDKICVGPGTVLTLEQVVSGVESGADYIISPVTNVKIIKKTKELGRISIPGVVTPSEIVTAYNAGADVVKFFPAGILGVNYIKAVLEPLNHIPMVVFGGINEENINQFMEAGAIGAGVGGKLVDKSAISQRNFDKITKLAQGFVSKVR